MANSRQRGHSTAPGTRSRTFLWKWGTPDSYRLCQEDEEFKTLPKIA